MAALAPTASFLRGLFRYELADYEQTFYYVMMPKEEDVSETLSFFARSGYSIGGIFEIEGEREKAILFLRKDNDRSISYHYRRHVKVDGYDEIVDECYKAEDGYYSLHTSPRLFSVVGERAANCKDKTELVAENSLYFGTLIMRGEYKDLDALHKKCPYYYCIDRASEPRTQNDVIGDKFMKQYFRKVDFNYVSTYNPNIRFVEAPAIVVDLDRASAIVFNTSKADRKEGNRFPFLLDEHFVSFKLTKDNFDNDREMLSEYKTACEELNKKLQAWFDTIAGEMSHIPGMPYHLSFAEKRYILAKCFNSMIATSKPYRSRREKYEMACLRPCGFDLLPYLQKLAAIDSDGRSDKKESE